MTRSKGFLRIISSLAALTGESGLALRSAFLQCQRFHFSQKSERAAGRLQ